MKSRYILAALLAAASIAPVAAFAQEAAPAANPASAIPASDKQAIQNYNLNEDVFNRIVKVSQDAKKQESSPRMRRPISRRSIHSTISPPR